MEALASRCERLLRLHHPHSVHFIALHYLFPIQFTVGVTGNALNLAILNSYSLKTKSRTFLSCLAASDLAFLLSFLPEFFSTFPALALHPAFRRFYFATRMPCVSLANAFSAASIWFTLIVTIERLTGIRRPLADYSMPRLRLGALIAGVFCLALALTAYYNFWFEAVPLSLCANYTRLPIYRYAARVGANGSGSGLIGVYIRTSLVLGVILIVAAPMSALLLLNSLLIFYVRRSRLNVHQSLNAADANEEVEVERFGGLPVGTPKTERRMALTVITIVTSFILFNSPSAILHLWHYFDKGHLPRWYWSATQVSNCLVMTSKATNFLLYCMGSTSFRNKTVRLIRCQPLKPKFNISQMRKRAGTESEMELDRMALAARRRRITAEGMAGSGGSEPRHLRLLPSVKTDSLPLIPEERSRDNSVRKCVSVKFRTGDE